MHDATTYRILGGSGHEDDLAVIIEETGSAGSLKGGEVGSCGVDMLQLALLGVEVEVGGQRVFIVAVVARVSSEVGRGDTCLGGVGNTCSCSGHGCVLERETRRKQRRVAVVRRRPPCICWYRAFAIHQNFSHCMSRGD